MTDELLSYECASVCVCVWLVPSRTLSFAVIFTENSAHSFDLFCQRQLDFFGVAWGTLRRGVCVWKEGLEKIDRKSVVAFSEEIKLVSMDLRDVKIFK